MSLALDTLVLFIFIIIPGISFRRFYFQGAFTSQFNSKSLAHSFTSSILPGIIIQFATLAVYKSFRDLNGQQVKDFYENLTENSLPSNLFDTQFLTEFFIYITLMLIMSRLIAEISWQVVRILKLDRLSPVFRFNNHWSYFFNGEIKDFKNFKRLIEGEIIDVRADVLIRIEDGDPRLYSGKLKHHTLNKQTRELDCVYLTNAHIYKKNSDGMRVKRLIPGDILILNAKDIININLNYATIIKTKKSFRNRIKESIPLIYFSSLLFLLFTNLDYFTSNTLFKTILLKLFFSGYFLFISIFMQGLMETNLSAKQKSANKGSFMILITLSIIYYILRFKIF